MFYLKQGAWCVVLLMFCFGGNASTKSVKKCVSKTGDAILLVTFGSSYEAPQKTFQGIEKTTRETFKNSEVRWAYTSSFICKKLKRGDGQGSLNGHSVVIDNPEGAIRKFIDDSYLRVSIQSLHIIPGEEFDDLVECVDVLRKEFPQIQLSLGRPLLDTQQDIEAVAKILVDRFSAEVKNSVPILLMGHGSAHHQNHQRYLQLEAELQNHSPYIYMGTVERAPMIDDLIESLKSTGLHNQKLVVTPFMSIVGDHANNDLVGDTRGESLEDQSWKDRLEGEGYRVKSDMTGLGDIPEIVDIWMNHLKAINQ